MRKTILFIAMSLDGYIADPRGRIDWLAGQNAGGDDMEAYQLFIKDIDTVVMGWNTYHQIVVELSPDEWPYQGLESYVVTHNQVSNIENINFTDENPADLILKLKQERKKDIWICGGADLAGQLIQNDLIDRYHISVIPIVLGQGIRLFNEQEQRIQLKLFNTKAYNGIVDLIYERR